MNAEPDDDFDDPDTTGAQDAAMMADTALRAASGLATEGMLWYALEHLDQAVTLDRKGVTDMGSGPDGDRWDAEILAEPHVATALDKLERCFDRLEGTERVTQALLDDLRLSLAVLDP